MSVRSEFLRRLTRVLADGDGDGSDPVAHRLCATVVDLVGADDSAVILAGAGPDRAILCATSEAARRFEEAQDLAGEGPSLEALSTGRVVGFATADECRARWPRFAAAAGAARWEGLDAWPMQPGHALVGVLTVHRRAAGPLATAASDLEFLANAVGAVIVGGEALGDGPALRWSERDRIAQATGMVIAQLDLGPGDALAVIRAHAFAEDATVTEISRRVVARELRFGHGADRDGGGA